MRFNILDKLQYFEGDNGAAGGGAPAPAPAPAAAPGPSPVVDTAPAAPAAPAAAPERQPSAPAPTAPEPSIDLAPGADGKFDLDDAFKAAWNAVDENDSAQIGAKPQTSNEPAPTDPATPAPADPSAQPADPNAAPAPVDPNAAPVDPAPPQFDEITTAALRKAAELLGINETDPAKLGEAIEARQTEMAAERQRQVEQADLAFEQQAVTKIQQDADQAVTELMNPAIRQQMISEGYQMDVENWWLPQTWEDGTVAAAMIQRYNQIRSDLRAQPIYEQAYLNEYNARKSAYDGEKARLNEFSTKYPHHSAELVGDLRRAGVSADGLELIARQTHQAVEKAIATHNSATAAQSVELTQLRAKLAGYEAAIAQAKAEGVAEGRNAALQTLQQGQSLPNTVGLGGHQAPAQAFDPNQMIFGIEDIPWADNRI